MAIRTSTQHVNVKNPLDVVYARGDESTDGSIRFSFSSEDDCQIERRRDGVWNTTELELGEDSLLLGPNLSISALGSSVKFSSVDGDREAVPLDIPITTSGTSEPRAINAAPRFDRIVVQPVFTNELTTALIELPVTTAFQGFVYTIYLKIGSTAPTDSVTLTVSSGLTAGGKTFYNRTYPASDFAANTEVVLEGPIDFGTFVGDEILLTISSGTAFSLLTNSSDIIWFAVDFQIYTYEEVISIPTGTNKFLSDSGGAIIVNNIGNLILNAEDIN